MTNRSLTRLLMVGSLLLLAGPTGSMAANEANLVLVESGKPRASILLSQKPTASAQLAAFELQFYLEKISGGRLPIVREPARVAGTVILVGESQRSRALGFHHKDFLRQEYVVQTHRDGLLLMGHDGQEFTAVQYDSYSSLYAAGSHPIGTCYAVHSFLENQLGVKWYLPNQALGEVVPKHQTIPLTPVSVRRRPDLLVRSIYPLFTNTEKLTFTQWDKRQEFKSSWVNARTSLLYWIRNRVWGAKQHNANHSFSYYDKAFGASHPEWFSTKSLGRMKQLNFQTDIQPCLAARGFREQVVSIARDYFSGRPEPFPGAYRGAVGKFFSVMPNDNTNMCGCPDCRRLYRPGIGPAGNASHYVWDFVNNVAREVRKTHPQAMISNCAYFNYTLPPQGLVFEPNVAIEFCKFYTNYATPGSQRRDHLRIAEFVNKNQCRFFTTWEYLLKPHITEWAFPCMVPHVHAADVKAMKKISGFQGGKLQYLYLTTYNGTRPGGVAQANPVLDFMNLYWRMKLYDDTTLDIDVALDEYYQSFFGPAALEMKAFHTALEKRWMNRGGGQDSRSWWNRMGTREFLDTISQRVQRAREATSQGTVYRRRVDLIDKGILQHMLKSRTRYEASSLAEAAPLATSSVARTRETQSADTWFDDATWTDSPVQRITTTLKNQPAPQKTTFQLAWDEKWFYIKATCDEPLVSALKARTRDRDVGGFSDDSIELFFDPTGQGTTYYQFCITSRGVVYDAKETPGAIGATANINWNSGIKVRTTVGKQAWELRAALPLDRLGGGQHPRPGSTWRFNLCRNRFTQPGHPPFSAWSPTPTGFRNPARFGLVTFNAPTDRGNLIWSCDFSSRAFGDETTTSPLFGHEGWYENTRYSDRGWDRSLTVSGTGAARRAVCDINSTCPSDVLPMHAVRVTPGVVSVEAEFRRGAIKNQPTLSIADANGKMIANMHAWSGRGDLIAVELPEDRRNFGNAIHGLGDLAAPGRWFGLKLVINTVDHTTRAFVRSDRGRWVALNEQPLPYYDPTAMGTTWFLALGTYKHVAVANNVLEIDNIAVRQVSRVP